MEFDKIYLFNIFGFEKNVYQRSPILVKQSKYFWNSNNILLNQRFLIYLFIYASNTNYFVYVKILYYLLQEYYLSKPNQPPIIHDNIACKITINMNNNYCLFINIEIYKNSHISLVNPCEHK